MTAHDPAGGQQAGPVVGRRAGAAAGGEGTGAPGGAAGARGPPTDPHRGRWLVSACIGRYATVPAPPEFATPRSPPPPAKLIGYGHRSKWPRVCLCECAFEK